MRTGRKIFKQSCRICQQVRGKGTGFDPDLSQISAKLAKEGLYEAILNPNAGINFRYEDYILTLNDGSKAAGIIRARPKPNWYCVRRMDTLLKT